MTTFYLTKEEQILFSKLPEELTKGSVIENEGKFDDSEEKRKLRFSTVKFASPALLKFQKQAEQAKTDEELVALVENVDTEVDSDELMRLFFAIGPDGLSAMIESMINEAETAEDMNTIASLGRIRKEISISLKDL